MRSLVPRLGDGEISRLLKSGTEGRKQGIQRQAPALRRDRQTVPADYRDGKRKHSTVAFAGRGAVACGD